MGKIYRICKGYGRMLAAEDFVTQWTSRNSSDADNHKSAWWGSYDLAAFDPVAVSNLNISEESKAFLTRAGLPRKAYRGLFTFGGRFAALHALEEVQPHAHALYAQESYRVLGGTSFQHNNQTIYDSFVCLQDADEGRIYNVRDINEYPARLMNSSISQFAEFLLILRGHFEQAIQNQWDENLRRLPYGSQPIHRLRAVDAAAFRPNGGWEEVLLELEVDM